MQTGPFHPRSRRGYAGMAVVATMAIITSFSLIMLFARVIRSHESMARSQLQVDYAQKEDALLRSLLALVPVKAIMAMQDGSDGDAAALNWEAIFDEAIALAAAGEMVDQDTLDTFAIAGLIAANPGDALLTANDIVSPIDGNSGHVNSGTTDSTGLLFDSAFAARLPGPLEAPGSVMSLDGDHPLITEEKTYPSGWTGEPLLSVTDYPLFNLIPYPDIRFGFSTPGAPFVAKRNWWAFSLTFGADVSNIPFQTMTRHYVLSIYEVPSQLPLSASAFLSVGEHLDGTAWQNATVDGGVYGGALETSAGYDLPTGRLSARHRLEVGAGTTASGETATEGDNDFGTRESYFASSGADLLPATLSTDSGRVAFLPINRGMAFFEDDDVEEADTLSPTPWNYYSCGAKRCAMRLIVTKVESSTDQTPIEMEFFYQDGGGEDFVELERGLNWPEPGTSEGDAFPFQTEHLETGRKALVVYLERLPAYLAELGADGPLENHSLVINPKPGGDVLVPQFPSDELDLAVALRESGDLSPFANGFSLVTNLRLYFADNFNLVTIAQPPGSGLPPGEPFYPPVSIFAPEKRYGTTLDVHPVDYSGQISSLATGDVYAVHPLDFRGGTNDDVMPDMINADLKPIRSPAELPPIFLMNWLIVIQEILPDTP